MSVYPNNLDQNFPGYPYVDYLEYVDADQANAWVEAIQANQTVLGYGAAGTPANPLYSLAYNESFSTVTARIAHLEGVVAGLPPLNTLDSRIQTDGAANHAGSSGYIADAAHQHQALPVIQVPIGGIIMWPGEPATFPANFLACNGQGISTSTYNYLFTQVYQGQYKYGGSGGTFNLPPYNDKFLLGAGGAFAPAVGTAGGSSSISLANLPSHNHSVGVSDVGHDHGSFIHDGGGSTYYQGIYLAPGSGARMVLTSTTPPQSFEVSWSPGSPIDPGPQNHWNYGNASLNVSQNNVGSNAQFLPPFTGVWFLIRVI